MRGLSGRVAFITGAASGIGFALARTFAQDGMKVMLADIDVAALDTAVKNLRAEGAHEIQSTVCDVSDPASVDAAAKATVDAFGNVHLLCNNAGVAGGGGIDDISVDTWRWVLDVNLMGVVHGLASFLPHMRAHGEGGHVVNVASMGGLNSGLGLSPYSASKFAVVNISEGLAWQIAPHGIGVSVVCPGFVRTRIADSARNRQARYGAAPRTDPASNAGALAARLAELSETGLDPMDIAQRTRRAVRENRLYVFTHTGAGWRTELEERFERILTAMDDDAREC